MPDIHFPWILADADALVTILFMTIAFIGWVVNFVQQNKTKVPPKRPNGQQRPVQNPQSVQGEIEKFLKQAGSAKADTATGQRPAAGQAEVRQQQPDSQTVRRAPPPERRPRTQKEIWEEQTGKASAQPAQVRPQQPQAQRKPAPNQPLKQRQPSLSGDRGQKSGSLAKSPAKQESRLPSNFPSAGENRWGNQTGSSLTQQVATHLGSFTAASPQSTGEQARSETLSTRETPATRLAKMMKSPGSVRNAIMLSEVLSKPRALRR